MQEIHLHQPGFQAFMLFPHITFCSRFTHLLHNDWYNLTYFRLASSTWEQIGVGKPKLLLEKYQCSAFHKFNALCLNQPLPPGRLLGVILITRYYNKHPCLLNVLLFTELCTPVIFPALFPRSKSMYFQQCARHLTVTRFTQLTLTALILYI